jgi:molybdopterin converting factor small subunit
MRVIIECFGASRRWCGADSIALDLAATATVADALEHLAARYQELAARLDSVAVAIGDAVVARGTRVREGDRLALIPPVSGG